MVPDPARLVLATRAEEPGAAAELVERWLPVVLGWCNRLGGPTVDPEDVAQEVMVKALTHIHDIRQPERFAGWLFRVTRSALSRHRKAAWVRSWIPGASLERVDPRADPLADCVRHRTMRQVRLALETLPRDQREAIVLCDLEERTMAEAAALLQVPPGTVKSRLRLGRAKFRRSAARLGIAPDLLEEMA